MNVRDREQCSPYLFLFEPQKNFVVGSIDQAELSCSLIQVVAYKYVNSLFQKRLEHCWLRFFYRVLQECSATPTFYIQIKFFGL